MGKTSRRFPYVRRAFAALCGTLVLASIGVSMAWLGPRAMIAFDGASYSADFAEKHVAAMRARLAAIHRGRVDDAMLAKIAQMSGEDGARGTAVMPANFRADDVGAITRYLTSPPEKAAAESANNWSARRVAEETPKADTVTPQEDRTYVGQKTCETCHAQEAGNWAHTIHASVFTLNPRDAIEAKGCEACHGPGSAHVADPSNYANIISFSHKSVTPVAQQNGQCLSCHQGGPRIFWHGSIHENNKLACSDCHNPMANFAAHGLTARNSINETCFSCHKLQRAEFHKRSHMPLPEGKITCVDCHNPHGSTTAPLLKADSVNEVCYGCHAEKRGPFLFEHAPVRENCLNCHSPHGSNFESLLTAPRPMLCLQCHAQDGHPAQLMTRGNLAGGPMPDPRLISTSCQTCHVNIHGSNSPSGSRFER